MKMANQTKYMEHRFERMEDKFDQAVATIIEKIDRKADKKMVYTLFGTAITLFALTIGMLRWGFK